MSWESVGDWIKNNAGSGAALVGSLLTGNVAGAVAAGVSMVSSATGTNDPQESLYALQNDGESLVKLKQIALDNDISIRRHIEEITRLELEDKQKQHEQTQKTIRHGDEQESKIRWVRPTHATLSLCAAIYYILFTESPNFELALLLLSLPAAYSGLRQVGKWREAGVSGLIGTFKK